VSARTSERRILRKRRPECNRGFWVQLTLAAASSDGFFSKNACNAKKIIRRQRPPQYLHRPHPPFIRRPRNGKILEQKVVITDEDSRDFADGRKSKSGSGVPPLSRRLGA
jgi:hypothetical protein